MLNSKAKIKVIIGLFIILFVSFLFGLSVMTEISFADSNSSDFKNGYGTADSPYEISTIEEFNNVRYHRDAYFIQKDNLDFVGYDEFSPIGSVSFPFTGHYDGGKYQINNIHIKQNSNNVGLFAFLDKGGVVENLKIVNSEINGEYNVGAIVGINRGIVAGCISTAKVSGNGAVGGIVGLNAVGGEVKECGNLGNVISIKNNGKYVGGVVGVNNAQIQNCYNQGDINSEIEEISVTYSGGISGLNDGESYDAVIDHCYNIGTISGNARGQVVGDNIKGKISNCKWLDRELDKVASFDSGNISDVVALSSAAFKSENSFIGWDFENTWMYIKNESEFPLLNREYVKVDSVSFTEGEIEIQPGRSIELKAVVKPIHATNNIPELVLNSNIAGVSLNDDNILSIAKTVAPDTVINVTAKVENKSANLNVKVVKIPVESVELVNLDEKCEISQLRGLHFKAKVYPEDASKKEVEFTVNSSFAKITQDGFLTLTDDAPTDAKITVSAVSVDNPMKNDSMTVNVVKESVTSVTINSDHSFKVNGSLKLSATVLPEKATYKDVSYKIISSTAEGAKLINNVLTTKGLGEITVIAEADGVKSEEFTVQVLKEPVTEVLLNVPETITCGDILVLNATILPANATYQDVGFSIIGENTAKATIKEGVLFTETAGRVKIKAVADGIVCEKEITVHKIPVNSIEPIFADSFKHTEKLVLGVNILPANATYKDNIFYEIISDSADSRIDSGILYSAKPGTVTVRVAVDGLSAEKTVSVLKEEVQSVNLNAVFEENDLGEVYQFVTSIYPVNATNKEVSYVLKSGNATLSEDGLLIIDASTPEGSLIEVYAVVDGVESAVYEIKSGRIAVKNVTLAATSETIKVGEGIRLTTSTVPAIVSNPGVTYVVDGNAEVVDGVLYVNDFAAVGTTVKVTAVVDGISSNSVYFDVIKTPVENITITSANLFKVTESLKLMASVYPQNATDKAVTFSVISGTDIGAEIINGYLHAEKVGVIKVRASAGDISRDVVICVQKEPVTKVVLTSALQVKVNDTLKLTAMAYPFNATNRDVTFKLINNTINAEIFGGNILFSSQVGNVTVRVNADGIYADYEIEVMKEPVTGIVFGAKTVFKHTESLKLLTHVLPTNATYSAVTYSILRDYEGYENIGAYISNGKLYANKPGSIKLLIVTDNGDYKETIEIEVAKEPVTGITMADFDKLYLDYGYRMGQIDLNTIVYPLNATYNDVEYSFDTVNCTANIDDNVLTVVLNELKTEGKYAAEEQASVTVKAVADGVEFYKTYVFNKKDLESADDIKFNSVARTFKTSGQLDFDISLPENITYKDIKVEIIKQPNDNVNATFINNDRSITAEFPGTIVVKVTSLCSGVSKDFEITVAEEEVKYAVLGLEIDKDSDTDKIHKEGKQSIEAAGRYEEDDTKNYSVYKGIEVQQGSVLLFRGFGYAEDKNLRVTYGRTTDFELKVYKDGKDITSSCKDYLTVEEGTIRIAAEAPVTAEIYVCVAVNKGLGNGLESKRTKLIIQSAYINEINNVHITEDGVISGLESICGEDGHKDIEKIGITIKHSPTGITLKKEINTHFPTVILQLYNDSLGGYFDVEYEIFFKQTLSDNSTYKYSYKRIFKNDGASDNSFKGLSGKYSKRKYVKDFSSIVWLDDYSNYVSNYTFDNEVKAVYIYNKTNYTVSTYLKFTGDSKNQIDLYLHNYGISAPTNHDAILVNNGNSGLKLTVIGNSDITGGNGSVCNKGRAGINCSGALTLEGNILNVYGGQGGTGSAGTQGSKGYTGGRDDDGYGTKGGTGGRGSDGGTGYTGGSAIMCKTLSIDMQTLNVTGGKGGTGGQGGQGGTGGTGGTGRDAGGFKYSRNGGDGGTGGTGGTGGQGGNGGYAIKATSVRKTSGIINLYGGAAGDAGIGGYGGDGGQGGRGGKYWNKDKYRDNGNKGDSGSSGNSGSSGYNGSALSGINLSGSNITIG